MQLATLCYLTRSGRHGPETLFIHRNQRPDDIHYMKHVGLGGRMERGECPFECVVREFHEESGLLIARPELKGIITFDNTQRTFGGNPADEDWYVFTYVTGEFSGDRVISPEEGEVAWVSDAAVPSLSLHEGDRIFLPWLSEPGVFEAKLSYEGEDLTDHSVRWYARN